MLKLHVTTKYLSWRKGRLWNVEKMAGKKKNRRWIWFPLRLCCWEDSHTVNPWRVVFPEIVSLVLTSTCWPNTVMAGTDAEVHGHTGTLQIIEKSFMSNIWGNISAAGIPSKIAGVTWSSVCSVSAGLHGIYFLFKNLNLMVILCLNIYPQFIVSGDFIRVGLYRNKLVRKLVCAAFNWARALRFPTWTVVSEGYWLLLFSFFISLLQFYSTSFVSCTWYDNVIH